MKLSLEKLQEYSEATGFRVQALEKVIRLAELLADIGRHPLTAATGLSGLPIARSRSNWTRCWFRMRG